MALMEKNPGLPSLSSPCENAFTGCPLSHCPVTARSQWKIVEVISFRAEISEMFSETERCVSANTSVLYRPVIAAEVEVQRHSRKIIYTQ